jgi:hypothetical protein
VDGPPGRAYGEDEARGNGEGWPQPLKIDLLCLAAYCHNYSVGEDKAKFIHKGKTMKTQVGLWDIPRERHTEHAHHLLDANFDASMDDPKDGDAMSFTVTYAAAPDALDSTQMKFCLSRHKARIIAKNFTHTANHDGGTDSENDDWMKDPHYARERREVLASVKAVSFPDELEVTYREFPQEGGEPMIGEPKILRVSWQELQERFRLSPHAPAIYEAVMVAGEVWPLGEVTMYLDSGEVN